jgi:hypothetical protein
MPGTSDRGRRPPSGLASDAVPIITASGARDVSHQRVVHTFVTNLHGPENPLTFGGAAVQAIIPIPSTTGNVTVTFAAASYAGTLRITILSDPARMPDAPALAAALRHELSASDKPRPVNSDAEAH